MKPSGPSCSSMRSPGRTPNASSTRAGKSHLPLRGDTYEHARYSLHYSIIGKAGYATADLCTQTSAERPTLRIRQPLPLGVSREIGVMSQFPQMAVSPPDPARDAFAPDQGHVVTRAVLRAAEQLNVTARALSSLIGVSEASLSRMKTDDFSLAPATKPFELAVLFVRLFRSLDTLAGGNTQVARAWLVNSNAALNGRPVDKIQTITGLLDVIVYLDARRARV